MESIYSYLKSINTSRQADCTLFTVRRHVEDFAESNPNAMGSPPFTQFAQWLARRYGRSKQSLYGRWTRFDGGYWRILTEEFGDNSKAVDAFFELLFEYQNQERRLVWASHQRSHHSFDFNSQPREFQLWEWNPEGGCDLVVRFVDGRIKAEGYYSSVRDAMNSAKAQYKIELDDWESVTMDNF